MKFDFNYYNPTKIYFGKTALNNLKKELANYGENILLVYGKNSIKKNGLYNYKVMEILKEVSEKKWGPTSRSRISPYIHSNDGGSKTCKRK